MANLPPGQRGEKGEPGSCDCGGGGNDGTGGRQNSPRAGRTRPQLLRRQSGMDRQPGTDMLMNSASVRIMDSYKSFSDVSYALQEGAIVFTADEKELFLKIDHQLNEWISVASYIEKRPRRMPFPTTPSAGSTRAPQAPVFLSNVVYGPKLRLVALPYLLPGDLYYKSGSSILGGDYACQDAAQKVGMTRSYFKVFLNGMYSSLDTVVHRTQRTAVPVVNYYGQRLFNSFEEMLNNGNWNNRIAIQDFGGKDIAQWTENIGRKEILAWQGVRRSQRLSEPFTPDCEGFSNRDKLKTGRATNLLSGSLFQSREITCDSRLVVLCIEAFDENSDTLNPMDYRRK
ncbi:hypothetical protein BOX15_Mlig000647g2 [Macrostomum lignano]|nr:hypothetical protein BOX15_Mlig000647g2 [Macrostomum lignano]